MKEDALPMWERMTKTAEQKKQHGDVTSNVVKSRCLACGQPENIVWVHGHGQCTHCKSNVMPCCDGATRDYFDE